MILSERGRKHCSGMFLNPAGAASCLLVPSVRSVRQSGGGGAASSAVTLLASPL